MHTGWKDVLKVHVEYNDPHKFASKLRGFPFTLLTNTVGHFKNLTVLVNEVKGKPCNLRHVCVDHFILLY